MGIISGVKECLLGIYEKIITYLYGAPSKPKKQLELRLIKEDASLYTFGIKETPSRADDLESINRGSFLGTRNSLPNKQGAKKTKSLKDEIEEEEQKSECSSPLSMVISVKKTVRFVNELSRKNSSSKRSFFSISGSSQRNGTLKSNKSSADFLTARSSFSDNSDSGLPGFENKEILHIDQPPLRAKVSCLNHLRKMLKADPRCSMVEYEVSELSADISVMEAKNINAGRRFIEEFMKERLSNPKKFEKIFENESLESCAFLRKDNAISLGNIYYLYCSWTNLRRKGRKPDLQLEYEALITYLNKKSLLLSDNDINNEVFLIEDPTIEQPYLVLINHNKNIFANNSSTFLHVQSFSSEDECPLDSESGHLGKYINNLIQLNFSLNCEDLEETVKGKKKEIQIALNSKGLFNHLCWFDQYEKGYRVHSYYEISYFENIPPAIAKNKFTTFFKKFFSKDLETLI